MNIAQLRQYDISNGPGVRMTVFVSGCTHNCPGCFNKDYQDFSFGEQFTDEKFEEILKMADNPKVVGINILGGEPLQQGEELVLLLRQLKVNQPEKPIWLWTGYTYEHIANHPALDYVDILIDGKFDESKKDLRLQYRGSSNQRIIDLKEIRNAK